MDIDSAAGTQILKFNGNLEDVSYLQYEMTALGYRLLGTPGQPPPSPFHALVIGTGGGRDLLSALVFGATSVDGVEINPIIVNDVMRDKFREYSGGIYDRPNVRVAVEDGRSFVRRSPKQYDIIQASLVDTWAATAAGAYALSENSLYTVEAFDDYLDHLTDRGVLSVSRWVFDGLRLISLAQEAGARRGWNPSDRLAIIQHENVATFLLKKTPFTPEETQRLAGAADDLGFAVIYLPGRPVRTFGDTRDDYVRLLQAPDRHAFYRDYPLDVTPTTDDRPFFFNTTRLRNHSFVAPILRLVRNGRPAPGECRSVGHRRAHRAPGSSGDLLVSDRALHPRPAGGDVRGALGEGWFRSLAYFACLGGAFMLIEVALLQRFVLLLGHPVYSLTVTLFSLLLGTGLGSVLESPRGRRRSAPNRDSRVRGGCAGRRAVGQRAAVDRRGGDRLAAAAAHPARCRADDAGRNGDGHSASGRRPAAGREPAPAGGLGVGHERRLVGPRRHPRRLHRDALGLFRDAALRRRDLRRRRCAAHAVGRAAAGQLAAAASAGRSDLLESAHVGTERRWDRDGAVPFLVVLQDRDQRTPDGEARSIQRVDVFHLAGSLRTELDVGAARLERHRVAAGRDLAVGLLARQPDLDVVGLRGGESHVAGAQQPSSGTAARGV